MPADAAPDRNPEVAAFLVAHPDTRFIEAFTPRSHRLRLRQAPASRRYRRALPDRHGLFGRALRARRPASRLWFGRRRLGRRRSRRQGPPDPGLAQADALG